MCVPISIDGGHSIGPVQTNFLLVTLPQFMLVKIKRMFVHVYPMRDSSRFVQMIQDPSLCVQNSTVVHEQRRCEQVYSFKKKMNFTNHATR